VVVGDRVADGMRRGATRPGAALRRHPDHLAFYAQLLDCWVDGERVTANEGTFYGGWITSTSSGRSRAVPAAHW
jgi:hypothetical protein